MGLCVCVSLYICVCVRAYIHSHEDDYRRLAGVYVAVCVRDIVCKRICVCE